MTEFMDTVSDLTGETVRWADIQPGDVIAEDWDHFGFECIERVQPTPGPAGWALFAMVGQDGYRHTRMRNLEAETTERLPR